MKDTQSQRVERGIAKVNVENHESINNHAAFAEVEWQQ
jgi:GTP cyclohydrolase FolE2